MADLGNISAIRIALAFVLGTSLFALGGRAQARPVPRGRPAASAAARPQAVALAEPVTPAAAEEGNCPRAIVFRNQSSSALRLRIGSELQRNLGKGVTAHLCTQAEHLSWQVSARSGWQTGGDVDLRDLAQRDVLISDPDASLRVLNRSGEDQRLTLDGRDLGVVKGGEQRLFGSILPQAHRILARGTHSNDWRSLRFVARVGQMVRLDLRPAATVADVYNTSSQEVALRIDGLDYGVIPASSSVRVLGLAGGRHEAVLIGKDDGQVTRRTVRVSRAGEAQRPAEPLALSLSNASGEVLDVPEGLRNFASEIAPDAQATWTLPPASNFGINLTGRDSGLAYHYDVHARDAGKRSWRIVRPTASVRLTNRTGQPVAVLLPGLDVAHLDAGASTLVRVPAGRLKLIADLSSEQRQLQTGLFLKPGVEATWQIRSRQTAITVVNGHAEPLQVLLDGVQRAEVRPQGDLRLDVQPGRHRIEVRALLSRTVAMASLQLADGQQRKAYFDPPDGALRLDHADGDAPLLLLARGVKLAEVPKGGTIAVDVMPGRVSAEVRDTKSEASTVWSGSVAPTQQVDLERPPRATVPLELENATAHALRATLDGGEPHELAAGATWRVADVRPGTHVLSLESGAQQLRRRIEVDADKPLVRLRLRDLP